MLKKPLYNAIFITSLHYNVTLSSVPKLFFPMILYPSITSLFLGEQSIPKWYRFTLCPKNINDINKRLFKVNSLEFLFCFLIILCCISFVLLGNVIQSIMTNVGFYVIECHFIPHITKPLYSVIFTNVTFCPVPKVTL